MSDEQNSATARIKARSLAIMWVGADQEEAFVDDIAAALLAAEQRGREMERERCIAIITRPLGEGCHAGGLGARSGSEQGKGE